MKRMRITGMGMTLLLATGGSVSAEPMLLASRSVPSPGIVVGTPEIFESRWPVIFYPGGDNEIIAPLFEGFALPPEFPVDIIDTVSAQNDSDFPLFATRLTDGVDQDLVTGAWDEAGFHGGGGGPESSDMQFFVPRLGPDLVGYRIDHITQILTVDIQSPGSDPFGDGMWTDWSVTGTYQFFGSVIPEPHSAILLLLGATGVFTRRLRRGVG